MKLAQNIQNKPRTVVIYCQGRVWDYL